MNTASEIPKELYYLDERFSVRSLRKYQLKEILTAHNIPYLSNLTRVDLIDLFRKHIESRREEILREYKQRHAVVAEEKTYGRGRRVSQKPKRYEDTVSNYLDGITTTKDADGFKIPSLPIKKEDDQPVDQKSMLAKAVNNLRTRFSPPPFNEEDSVASSSEDNHDNDDDYEVETSQEEEYDAAADNNADGDGRTVFYVEDEDEDDTDYYDDSDFNEEDYEEDDDEELGSVDKDELVQLYKDQLVPPTTLIFPRASRANTSNNNRRTSTTSAKLDKINRRLSIWKARFKQALFIFCALYMMIGMIGFFITSYARQKNGYCQSYTKDINNNNNTTTTTTPSTLSYMLPSSCIPCPDHGICTEGVLTCETMYQQKTPFYNRWHILPIADECVHDSVLGRQVSKVEKRIKKYLAEKQGEAYCGKSSQEITLSRIPVNEVMDSLKEYVEKHMPADGLDQILLIAFSTVLKDPEVHYWETDGKRFLGTSRYKLSITCQLKRLYLAIPTKIKLYIIAFISVFTGMYGATKDYRDKKMHQQKIDKMVKSIVDQLKLQYDNHITNDAEYPSPRLPVSQLRTSVVDFNNSKTIADWKGVVQKAESHPHIKKSIEEANGDIVEYWELNP